MFQCKPCGKIFSGQCNYDQHIISVKHKKKMQEINFSNTHDISPMNSSYGKLLQCRVCNSAFDTMENFQKHVESPQHALKVIEEAKDKVSDNAVSTSNDLAENYESNTSREMMNVDPDDSLVPGFGTQKLFYGECKACDKTFSGPEPYKQHIQSNEHQRKIGTRSSEININMASLSCKICKKNFSGHVPYEQHMNSETHKKKEQQSLFMSLSPQKDETDISRDVAENTSQWFCKICNTQCSGLIPYQQHLQGITHLKNVKKAQFYASYQIEDAKNIHKQENDSENMASQDSQIAKRECYQAPVQKIEEDCILPETGNRLDVISNSELRKLVTVILPNERIDFDKSENKSAALITDNDAEQENSDSSQKKDHEVPRIKVEIEEKDVIQVSELCDVKMYDKDDVICQKQDHEVPRIKVEIEEKAAIQVCEICDVKMYDKDDVICHYESEGHFKRKWSSN